MTEKSEKILIVRKGHSGGGIERASSLMANYFASKGETVVLLSLYDNKYVFDIDHRIEHINLLYKESKNRVLRIYHTTIALRKEIKKTNPSVILSYGEYVNVPTLLATRCLNIPVIISDRLSPLVSLGKVYDFIKKTTYRYADGCIAQTETSKQILSGKTKMKNIIVIPNPVNIIEKVECEQKNQIVTVGRISPEKGQKYLIEAFSKLKEKDWNLMIVGGYKKQQCFDDVKNLTIQLGVEDRVTFCGRKSDFSKELSESKIFVLPSLSEGYPNALIEAMSVPMACISSDCVAGPRDAIQDGVNGLLVPVKDSDALCQAIEKLIDNEELRKEMAKNAYSIREKLAKEKVAQQYLDYVKSFIKK